MRLEELAALCDLHRAAHKPHLDLLAREARADDIAGAPAKAVEGLDEVTQAALESAEAKVIKDARLPRDNVVSLASSRR